MTLILNNDVLQGVAMARYTGIGRAYQQCVYLEFHEDLCRMTATDSILCITVLTRMQKPLVGLPEHYLLPPDQIRAQKSARKKKFELDLSHPAPGSACEYSLYREVFPIGQLRLDTGAVFNPLQLDRLSTAFHRIGCEYQSLPLYGADCVATHRVRGVLRKPNPEILQVDAMLAPLNRPGSEFSRSFKPLEAFPS